MLGCLQKPERICVHALLVQCLLLVARFKSRGRFNAYGATVVVRLRTQVRGRERNRHFVFSLVFHAKQV